MSSRYHLDPRDIEGTILSVLFCLIADFHIDLRTP
jgi:hypothetical protein